MMVSLTAHIEQFSDKMFIGYIGQMKGLVVQSDSEEGVKKELITSVRVKLAYDYNLDINQIIEGKPETNQPSFVKQEDNTYKLQLV